MAMAMRVKSVEEAKPAAIILPMAQEHRRVFPAGMLRLFLGLMLLGVVVQLSAFRAFLARHAAKVATPAPALFQPCLGEAAAAADSELEEGMEQRVRPLARVKHAMTDKELLRLASCAPRARRGSGCPFRRVPKVAFMFLTRGPLPLAPLWERFFRGNEGRYSIYVHTMPLYHHTNFTSDSVFYGRQIPSQAVQWGEMTMCDAERRLLANAVLDISNEWFVLVSESCIPLFDFNTTYEYFQNSSYSFVMSIDYPGRNGRGRYNLSMAPEVELEQWRKGSQWFEADRDLAVAIIEDTVYYPKFKQLCRRPRCFPDEHYIQTMLNIEAPHKLANRTTTWVDWPRGRSNLAHPATFDRGDITEEFLKGVREGETCLYNGQNTTLCYLFARKFAPSALEPLLELAPTVLGFG